MRKLVALHLPSAARVRDELLRCWDNGDAAVVLDPRLPAPALQASIDSARPHLIVDADGTRSLAGAAPLDDATALVMATSGSTGEPRCVEVSHAAVESAARLTSAALQVDPERDRWLACLPLSHVGGLGVLTRALLTGTPVTVVDRPACADIERATDEGASLVSLVPTVVNRCDVSRYRVVLVGGAASHAALPSNAVMTWGMTETFGGVIYDGRPLPGVQARVQGEELLVRSPTLGTRWRTGEPISAADGWLHTGDGATIAADGAVLVHGRLGSVINTGGEKVWPEAVEAALLAAPGVAEALVHAIADPEWGERVHAVVVPSDPTEPPHLQEHREQVGASLPAWCAPRSLEIAAVLPRTPGGKLRRPRRAPDALG